MQEAQVQSLAQEDPLEKEMATHSSTLVWRIPWTEEPGGVQSMGLQRVGHNNNNTGKMLFKITSRVIWKWKMEVLVAQSGPTFCHPMDYITFPSPLSIDVSTQEYWSG